MFFSPLLGSAFLVGAASAGGIKLSFDRIYAPRSDVDDGRVLMQENGEGSLIPFTKEVALHNFVMLAEQATLTSVGRGVYYVGPVTVGTQTFKAIYDTGSNLLWIPGKACGVACTPHTLYTGAVTSSSFSVSYLSGSVSGSYANAVIDLAGANLDSFKLGVASTVSLGGYSSMLFDGVFGLAWPSLSDTDSVVPALFASGQIPSNLFTIYLSPDKGDGELSLGGVDTSKFTGDIAYMTLTKQSWWTVKLNGLVVGSFAQIVEKAAYSVIIDSGSTLIIGPSTEIIDMVAAIQESGVGVKTDSLNNYFVLCSASASVPSINITMSGSDNQQYYFVIPGQALVMAGSSGYCQLALQGMSSSSGFSDWVLGDPFMRSFYSVFDYGSSRVGLAIPVGAAAGTQIVTGDIVVSFASPAMSFNWVIAAALIILASSI